MFLHFQCPSLESCTDMIMSGIYCADVKVTFGKKVNFLFQLPKLFAQYHFYLTKLEEIEVNCMNKIAKNDLFFKMKHSEIKINEKSDFKFCQFVFVFGGRGLIFYKYFKI